METLLSFNDLTDGQKAELQKHAKKVAAKENVGIKEVYDSFKHYFFQIIDDHLHFAIFHPISMLEYE